MTPGIAACSRLGLGMISAAVLAGCTALGAPEPLFPADAYERAGPAEPVAFKGFDDEARFIVIPKGEGRFGVGLYGRRDEDAGGLWQQDMYAEGGAIALGGGAFALQAECVRGLKDGEVQPVFAPRDGDDFADWSYYMLALSAGVADTYWLMAVSGDEDRFGEIRAAAARHGATATRRTLGSYEVLIVLTGGEGADLRPVFAELAAMGASAPRDGSGKPVEIDLIEPATDVDVAATLAASPVTSCR